MAGAGAARSPDDPDPSEPDESLELMLATVGTTAARRLLLAGVSVFASRGYHAASTREIAAAAGVSPSALYAHFPSKEQLLFTTCAVGHRLALRSISRLDPAADPIARLRELVRCFTCWHAENPTLARVSQRELTHLEPGHRAEIAMICRSITAVFRGVIRDGLSSGHFADCDVRAAWISLISMSVDVARWYHPAGIRTPARLADQYAEFAVAMMTAR